MQCIILAGGLGTRMGHRTTDRPKAMIEVAGEPFVRHQLRLLRAGGIDDVVICVGYRGEIIEEEVAQHCPEGMAVRCSSDGLRLLGTAGAVRLAVDNGLADEVFMVIYGDSYLLIDFADVWASFDDSRYLGLMTVWRTDDRRDQSNAGVTDGRVAVYRKQADRPEHPANAGHPAMNYIDYGLGVLTAEMVLDLVPPGVPHDLADLYETVAARRRLQAYEVDQRFHEIGSESGLAELDHLLTLEAHR
jgi:NDP-sugar pyrophosphorylase family protein